MANDLLQRIREQSEINRRSAGEPPTASDTSYHDLLKEIQERVSQELSDRVATTISRFEERLDFAPNLDPAPHSEGNPERVLDSLERLESEVNKLSSHLESASDDRLARSDSVALTPEDFRQQLEEWWRDCETARSNEPDPATTLTELDGRIEQLRGRFDERLAEVESSASQLAPTSESAAELAEIRASLAGLESMWEQFVQSSALTVPNAPAQQDEARGDRSGAVTPWSAQLSHLEKVTREQLEKWSQRPEPASAPSLPSGSSGENSNEGLARLAELEDRLNSAVIALTQHAEAERKSGSGALDEDALSRWGQRLEQQLCDAIGQLTVVAPPAADPPGESTEAINPSVEVDLDAIATSESLLFARLESLEESLQRELNEAGEKVAQTIHDRCLEVEHTIPERLAEKTAQIESPSGEVELPESLTQLPEVVMGLRRDFSLLVHTINSHLEESRDQVDRIAEAVFERLKSEGVVIGQADAQAGSESAAPEELAIPAVETVASELAALDPPGGTPEPSGETTTPSAMHETNSSVQSDESASDASS